MVLDDDDTVCCCCCCFGTGPGVSPVLLVLGDGGEDKQIILSFTYVTTRASIRHKGNTLNSLIFLELNDQEFARD